MIRLILATSLLCAGCASQLAALRGGDQAKDVAFEEIRTELAELRHSLHATVVEIGLLEEKLETQNSSKAELFKEELAALEARIINTERNQEKIAIDLRNLSAHANQTVSSLLQYQNRIQELELPKKPSRPDRYLVKSGDTLKKIASRFQISVESLKDANRLSSDRIIAGQELSIPSHDTP